jgi:arginase
VTDKTILLIGVPMQCGAGRPGCVMGPAAYRTAGLAEALAGLGHAVEDRGDVMPRGFEPVRAPGSRAKNLAETAAWTDAVERAAHDAVVAGALPVFLGGDHAMSGGTVAGAARAAAEAGRPLFVLWLDSHPDLHRLDTTESGHLHGAPMAYVTGQPGFAGVYPPLAAPLPADHVCMMGLRSVDAAERRLIAGAGVEAHDMRAIDEHGVAKPLRAFLARVAAAGGMLHVSLDVDFLDPEIAPAVGTTVPGGATFREAHLIMEMVWESGLACSLDLAELNPFLDERGRTARLMTDLAASLLGRRVLDRPISSA